MALLSAMSSGSVSPRFSSRKGHAEEAGGGRCYPRMTVPFSFSARPALMR